MLSSLPWTLPPLSWFNLEIKEFHIWPNFFAPCFSCEFNGIDEGYAKDYCWVHGSNYIPTQYQVTSTEDLAASICINSGAHEMRSGP